MPVAGLAGCRNRQHAHVLSKTDEDMVGSHAAGAETWKPLIDEAVGRILGRQMEIILPAGHLEDALPVKKRICFVGVENRSSEEIGDFKEQIYQQIDTIISQSDAFAPISRRYVEAGLRESRIRPDQLFIPTNQRMFAASMEQLHQPFDYLLFATITSGTTRSNNDYQRDYMLTLELVNIQTGDFDKESANLRKGYHKSALGKLKHYGT
ncbi:MAG: penicillin-binding protein activator LpoB [Maioricimonas sp. JB049]